MRCPKNFESHSRISAGSLIGALGVVGTGQDGVARPVHHAEVHAGEVFADDSEGEELGSGEDGDRRGQKRKPGHRAAFDEVASEHVNEQRDAQTT